MSHQVPNDSIKSASLRLLLSIASDLRKQAKEHRAEAEKADAAAQALETLLKDRGDKAETWPRHYTA